MRYELLNLWSNNTLLSILVWCALSMLVLYLGRKQAHQILYGLGRALYGSFRMMAFAIAPFEREQERRNLELADRLLIASSVSMQLLLSSVALLITMIAASAYYIQLSTKIDVSASVQFTTPFGSLYLLPLAMVGSAVLLGIVASEFSGLTNIFPVKDQLNKKKANTMLWGSLVLIACLSAAPHVFGNWGEWAVFISVLPVVVALTFMPMVGLVHSVRLLVGKLVLSCLRTIRIALRVLGRLTERASTLLRHLYDWSIVVPLGVERMVRSYLDREVEIDVPILTRVEAEAIRNKSRSTEGKVNGADLGASKAKFRSVQPMKTVSNARSERKEIERSSLDQVNLAETMMRPARS